MFSVLQQDCLTLTNVKALLQQGLEQHSQKCDYEPVFTVMSETEISNLMMTCPVSQQGAQLCSVLI